jgi:excisionase family DNA binding protein
MLDLPSAPRNNFPGEEQKMKKNELTIKDAVALTGWKRQRLYSAIANGEIEAHRPGAWEIFINRTSLLAYMAKHAKPASK